MRRVLVVVLAGGLVAPGVAVAKERPLTPGEAEAAARVYSAANSGWEPRVYGCRAATRRVPAGCKVAQKVVMDDGTPGVLRFTAYAVPLGASRMRAWSPTWGRRYHVDVWRFSWR